MCTGFGKTLSMMCAMVSFVVALVVLICSYKLYINLSHSSDTLTQISKEWS
jgi:hypothetical protein